MNNRDMFIDLVDELDVKYIDSHIRRIVETKKQKIARYATAGAIYAAACIVVILAIPLIIGGGDDGPVVPGTDPIVIETVETGTETETETVTEVSESETETKPETTVSTTEVTTIPETTVLTTETTATETTTTETTTPPVETAAPAPVVELGEGEYLNGNFVMDGTTVIKYVGNEEYVVIPEGTECVWEGAFDGCTSVKSITIPSTAWFLTTEGFSGAINLVEFIVADGNPSYYSKDGLIISKNFGSISYVPVGITELYIPAGIDGPGAIVLTNCTRLQKITVDPAHEKYESYDNVLYSKGRKTLHFIPHMQTVCNIPAETTELGMFSTNCCKALKEYNVDPANTKFISIDGAIYTDKGKMLVRVPNAMTEFTFPATVETVKQYAFWENRGITHLAVPANVEVGVNSWSMFAGCRYLESITIENFTGVPEKLFYGCTSLKSIVIPEGVEVIGQSAFNGCRSLETVIIPSTVKNIESIAFDNTDSLREITVAPENEFYVSVNGSLYTKDMSTLIR